MGTPSLRLLQSFITSAACKSLVSCRSISFSSFSSHRAFRILSRASCGPTTLLLATSGLSNRQYTTERMEKGEEANLEVPGFYADFCDLLSYASAHGPGFRVDASSVEIVLEPSSFYDQLLARIGTARRRIMLSSLYLGAEPQALDLIRALDEALASNDALEVVVLLDCLRGSRNTVSEKTVHLGGPVGTALEGVLSSVSLLYPLQLKYPGRFRAHYYHTPKLYGLLKSLLPERINELVGVQHTKCYIIDEDVLISGANLSEQYFTNRQDRYVWIRENAPLAHFYRSLMSHICDLSFRVNDHNGELVYPDDMPNPTTHPKAYNSEIKRRFEHLLSTHSHSIPSGTDLLHNADTWVFPTIQLGHAGVRHDEMFTRFILSHEPHSHNDYTTFMTSPYFNIAHPYEDAIKGTNKPYRLIVASPKANGFYNGSGLSGMVPWAYDTVLREWMANLPQNGDIEVYEYDKEGWTFHAKGVWIEMAPSPQTHASDTSSSSTDIDIPTRANQTSSNEGSHPIGFLSPVDLGPQPIYSEHDIPSPSPSPSPSPPSSSSSSPFPEKCSFSLVGSSNFGIRSMKRDLETQLAIFTTNQNLVERLKAEREHVFTQGQLVTEESFQGREENHSTSLRLVIPIATRYM